MTPPAIRLLENTLKKYNALWDHLERSEDSLDHAEENGFTTEITGWGISEMRDNLAADIQRLESAIKAAKKQRAAEIRKMIKKYHRKK
jgi:hypothetical protein